MVSTKLNAKGLKENMNWNRQCIFTEPILTLTVATGLGPEARNLFRMQEDFNDAFLSLEQICPEWQNIK